VTPPLVSMTRILNEDDIVEAFVRHNIVHLNHMIFLDNGSTDRTLAILAALKAEGLPLTVFQSQALIFDELSSNTWGYRLAAQVHRAGWVVFLDADEFLDVGGTLARVLESQPPKQMAVQVQLTHYFETPEDDESEPVVPLRMRWRLIAATNVTKLILRGGMDGIVIDAGNHGAFQNGNWVQAAPDERIGLMHYPRRNGWQNLQKCAIGWLKVLAAGEAAVGAGRSSHYKAPFELLRDDARDLADNPLYLRPGVDRSIMEDAPINYLGGVLRYWEPIDPAYRAFQLGLRYAEDLARQHGRILDASAEARALVNGWNGVRKFLF
jgi:hypothetical protein